MEEKAIIPRPRDVRFYCKTSPWRDPSWKENTWSYTLVEIFDKDQDNIKIGEYIRNYSGLAESTFYPFKSKSGEWYALYSERYTVVSVMRLPACEKIASTEDGAYAFCPAEIWVPSIAWSSYFRNGENGEERHFSYEIEDGDHPDDYTMKKWHHLDVGFCCGCVWGDDSSWKIQLLDLRKIEEGIIINKPSFGYIEVPKKIRDFSLVISPIVDDHSDRLLYVNVNGIDYKLDENFDVVDDD